MEMQNQAVFQAIELEHEARELEAPHQAVAIRVHHVLVAARDLRGHHSYGAFSWLLSDGTTPSS